MVKGIYEDDELYDALKVIIGRRVKGFTIKYKNKSRWQKFLGKLAFFCPTYMTRMVSTFGSKVYFPSEDYVAKDKFNAFDILAHEYVHLLDRQKHRIIFEILYTFPQMLALLAVLALSCFFLDYWSLFALVSLVWLLPLPSHGRMAIEMRGYAMNLAIEIWQTGVASDKSKDRIVKKFTGWSYYKMWPFENDVRRMLSDQEMLIYNVDNMHARESILDHSEAYRDVYELLTGIDLES